VWPETQEKVGFEIEQLHRLVDSWRGLVAKSAGAQPDSTELAALSAYLHSFYNGIENILKQIALDIDGVRLSSDSWHSDLLTLMSTPTEHRPALLSQDLGIKLDGYRGFRHVFRHAYTFNIIWEKMWDLVVECEAVLLEFEQACRALFEVG
jgi:hypothetical protein